MTDNRCNKLLEFFVSSVKAQSEMSIRDNKDKVVIGNISNLRCTVTNADGAAPLAIISASNERQQHTEFVDASSIGNNTVSLNHYKTRRSIPWGGQKCSMSKETCWLLQPLDGGAAGEKISLCAAKSSTDCGVVRENIEKT